MPVDRLETMRTFAAVASTGGFASAARRLGLSAPAVTRAIAALEARLGTRLLHRTTRVVRLTDAGAQFLADCRRILAEVEDAEAAAAGVHGELRGALAVTAPAMFGRLHVAPLVLEFLRRHRRVEIRTLLVDRVVNMLEEGLDVAVRIGPLPDSSLTAVRVGSVRRMVCAAPSYLAARGTPAAPADLAEHDIVSLTGLTPSPGWTFAAGDGRVTVPVAPRFTTNLPDVALDAVRAGHGLATLLSYQVAADLEAGRVVAVLVEFEPPPLPIHVMHGAGRRPSARVRAFVDHVVAALRPFETALHGGGAA